VPLKIAQLAGPQAMPKGDQNHGRVAVTIAARFRFHPEGRASHMNSAQGPR
jgi:hypothetical protein